jgi:hypothetical protein
MNDCRRKPNTKPLLTALALASLLVTLPAWAATSFSQSTSVSSSQSTGGNSSQSSSHSTFTVDLNGDGHPDWCETAKHSVNGRLAGHTTCYLALRGGRSQKVFELPYPISTFNVPGTRTHGWADLITQADDHPPHTWHWNGRSYQ